MIALMLFYPPTPDSTMDSNFLKRQRGVVHDRAFRGS